MLNLPRRLPYELLLAGALCLGSCDRPAFNQKQHDEITDIADASAEQAIADSDKVGEIEARLDAIENKLGMQ